MIFDGGSNQIEVAGTEPGTRRTVTIRPATMEQLPKIMLFFGGVVDGLDGSRLAQLVDSIVHAQKMAIARGADPSKVDLRELSSDELIAKAFDHSSLMADLFAAVFRLLPLVVESFTDITEDDFRKLGVDDGTLIAGGIFLLNYRFFTQSLRPIFMAFIKSWASKQGAVLPGMVTASRKATK